MSGLPAVEPHRCVVDGGQGSADPNGHRIVAGPERLVGLAAGNDLDGRSGSMRSAKISPPRDPGAGAGPRNVSAIMRA